MTHTRNALFSHRAPAHLSTTSHRLLVAATLTLALAGCTSRSHDGSSSSEKTSGASKTSKTNGKTDKADKSKKEPSHESDPSLDDEVDLDAGTWTFRLFGDEKVYKLVDKRLDKCGYKGVALKFADSSVVSTSLGCTIDSGMGAPDVDKPGDAPASLGVHLVDGGATDAKVRAAAWKKEIRTDMGDEFIKLHDENGASFIVEGKDITGSKGYWGMAVALVDGRLYECRSSRGGAPDKIDNARAVVKVCSTLHATKGAKADKTN